MLKKYNLILNTILEDTKMKKILNFLKILKFGRKVKGIE